MTKPSFADLEEAAGRAAQRSDYKLASHNVHAGIKGICVKLGSIDMSGFIGGASDAGLATPGVRTATALAQMNFVLLSPLRAMEDQIAMRVIMTLHDEIRTAFVKADQKLRKDNARIGREAARGDPKRPRRRGSPKKAA